MTTAKKLEDFKARFEKTLQAKFAMQKLDLGFELVKDVASNRVSLKVFDKKRPPTQFGSTQGAHTVAYSAVMRALCLRLDNVTVNEAKERLLDFHWDFYILYTLCVSSPKADCIDTIKKLADEVHQELRTESRQGKTDTALMTDYLTLFLYMHNLLPDAAVNMRSINRGESAALSSLQSLNGKTGSLEKATAISNLSVLIDEDAIVESLRLSNNLGTSLIGFQILGINRLLKNLPTVSAMVLGGDLISPTVKERINNEQLISDLLSVIFYKLDIEGVRKRDKENAPAAGTAPATNPVVANSPDKEKRELIKHALGWICDLQRVNYQAPYGTIARV